MVLAHDLAHDYDAPPMRGSLRQRGDTWELRVYAGHGRQVTRNMKGTRRQAERALAKLVVEVDEGRAVHTRGRTVATLADAWLEARATHWSPAEVRNTRRWLDHQFLPVMGKTPLGQVGTKHIDDFYALRRRSGVSEATVRRDHSRVRSMFAQGVKWGWVGTNPAVNTHRPPLVAPHIEPPDPAAIVKLLAFSFTKDAPAATFLSLAADTGARLGQLCALRWDDYDADGGTVTFTRTLSATGELRPLGKTKGRARTVPLGLGTVRTLSVHRTAMRERALAFGAKLGARAYMFSDDPACRTPWPVDTFKHRYIRLRRQAGPDYANLNFHQLRHFVATQLVAAGVDPRTVADRLGHSRTSTTVDMYAAPLSDRARDAADVLEDILGRAEREL